MTSGTAAYDPEPSRMLASHSASGGPHVHHYHVFSSHRPAILVVAPCRSHPRLVHPVSDDDPAGGLAGANLPAALRPHPAPPRSPADPHVDALSDHDLRPARHLPRARGVYV